MLYEWYFEELDNAMKKGSQNGEIYSDVIQEDFNLQYRLTFVPAEEGLKVFFISKTLDEDKWDWSTVEYRGMIYWNEIPEEYKNKIRAK